MCRSRTKRARVFGRCCHTASHWLKMASNRLDIGGGVRLRLRLHVRVRVRARIRVRVRVRVRVFFYFFMIL